MQSFAFLPAKEMTRFIGLTGSIATGKSTVAQMLVDHGAALLDADLIAREVVAPGSPPWPRSPPGFR